MTEFEFPSSSSKTTVSIAQGGVAELGSKMRELLGRSTSGVTVLITDDTVASLYGDAIAKSLQEAGWTFLVHTIKPGESSKRVSSAGAVYQFLADHAVPRDSVIIALGGGVVSDLAGFVAGTWMRGIQYVICPTTVEACVDASIGGKTAVNIPGGKNLVGLFYHPRLVLIDPATLRSLPARDVAAGMAESIKHGFLFSSDFLTWQEDNASAIQALAGSYVTELIERNVRFKAGIVERDATEQTGQRLLLNFGHTIGHAIEECSGFSLRHGECVSLGMIAACRLSNATGILSEPDAKRAEAVLARYDLPVSLPIAIPWRRIREVIGRDKKRRSGLLQFVLLKAIGQPIVQSDVAESDIRAAYESLC